MAAYNSKRHPVRRPSGPISKRCIRSSNGESVPPPYSERGRGVSSPCPTKSVLEASIIDSNRQYSCRRSRHFRIAPGHGKTRFPLMGQFFSHERYGRPQFLAGILLLMFVAQCVWLIARGGEQLEVRPAEYFRVQEGLAQLRGESIAGIPSAARAEAGTVAPPELESNEDYDPNHSPLWYLMSSAPLFGREASSQTNA